VALDENFEAEKVLLVNGAKISNYGGHSINLSEDYIKYQLNPKNVIQSAKLR